MSDDEEIREIIEELNEFYKEIEKAKTADDIYYFTFMIEINNVALKRIIKGKG